MGREGQLYVGAAAEVVGVGVEVVRCALSAAVRRREESMVGVS